MTLGTSWKTNCNRALGIAKIRNSGGTEIFHQKRVCSQYLLIYYPRTLRRQNKLNKNRKSYRFFILLGKNMVSISLYSMYSPKIICALPLDNFFILIYATLMSIIKPFRTEEKCYAEPTTWLCLYCRVPGKPGLH